MSVAVDICNDALNHVGAEPINDLADDDNIARTCARQYPIARDYILRQHLWNFAIQRDKITNSGASTIFGEAYKYIVPANCVRIYKVVDNNYQPIRYKVEKGIIYANPGAGFNVSTATPSGLSDQYIGNGVTVTFAITFSFAGSGQVKVTLDGVTQINGSNYNIVGTDVVFVTPPNNGLTILIQKDTSSVEGPSINLVYVDGTTSEHLFDPTFKKAVAAQLAADITYKITQSTTLMSGLLALAKDYVAEARSTDSMEGEPQDMKFDYFDKARRSTHEIYPDSDFF